ncbi:peptidoglycan-binding protein [Patescibacteria group bacterium]|nr:peptidoglycan-binding protein [Patescibacteria group bacterium]
MSKFKNSSFAKATAGFVGLASGMFMLGMVAVATPVQAQTIEELTAQIQSLLATITALQAQLTAMQGGTPATACAFTKDLTVGSKGDDVICLQTYLQGTGHFTFTGAKGYFGPITKAAVSAWQTANGVSPAVGYFGPISKAKYSALIATTPTTPTDPTTPPAVGTGLTVSSPVQPAASLAPESAARLPFTKITLTASADGDVTVDSVVVERVGLSADANFAGVVLLDENGTQVGIAKTLNSNHQATLSEDFVVKAGQSRTMTIGGNMASNNDTRAGQVAGFNVVAVNTSATVNGTFPITGAFHTINATLSIGSVIMQRGSVDPGASQTKEVGTTGYTFSSVRVTAGSAEKIMLNSIRWNQTGSASKTDLANLKTFVDGTAYDVVVSSDGKYYTSTFGSGIEIDKGFSKEMSIKGDIIGGSGRTIDFDLAKRTDVNVMGKLYGYGIIPPQTGTSDPTDDTAAFSSVEDPWYDAAQVTVSSGTITVSSDTTVAAQNIAVNLANQPLAGFIIDVKGETISVASMVFNVLATGDEAENITSISMVDKNGAVLAGPVDGVSTATDSAHGTITFTDTVTFPVGVTNIVLKGKLGTAFESNDTVAASTTPSSNWTTVTGQTTGNSLTPSPASAVSGLTMTVKAGALAMSQATQPVAQQVIAGQQGFEFARYILDGSQSGEDIRLTSFIALFADGTAAGSHLTNCQLYDGSKTLTTGSNAKNPTADNADQTFTFDGTGLTIPKGTSKTLSLKCNVSTSASGTFIWGLTNNAATFTGATGLTSGQTIVETMTANLTGITMTSATSGSYTVVADTSSAYNYKAVQAGTIDVPLAAFRFTAGLTEDIVLRQIALQLGNTASNSPSDLVGQQMTLWSGSSQVGIAQFGLANADNATSTLTSTVTIKKGEVRVIVVKGSLITHDANTNTTSTPGNGGYGAFLGITYDGNNVGLNGNYATGVASGATISSGTTSDVTTNGVRVFSSVPSIEILSSGGALAAGADLYKFKVTNPGTRDIAFKKFSFSLATTGGAVTGFTLYGDGVAANATAVNGVDVETVGVTFDAVEIVFDATSAAKLVSAGNSKTFVLRADTAVDTASVSETLNLALLADQAYPSLAYLMGVYGTSAGELNLSTASTTNNIIWSPSSTTTVTATAADEAKLDWTNGYGLPGFPSVGSNFPVQVFTRAN